MANCLTIGTRRWTCDGAPQGSFGEIVEARILTPESITSFSVNANGVASWVIAVAGDIVEGANNSILLNVATKGGETYPLAYDPTITIVAPGNMFLSKPAGGIGGDGYIIAIRTSSDKCYVVGLNSPLSLLSIEGVSNVNVNPTLTFGVEDWQAGATIYELPIVEYIKA